MSIRDLQERAVKFWRNGGVKKRSFTGPIKQIMLRSGNGKTCPVCGFYMEHFTGQIVDHTTLRAVTIEHILPRSLGGGHDEENLTVICKCCNLSRGLVYNNLKLNRDTLFRYVEWLFLQIENPHKALELFPKEHSLFIGHWGRMAKRTFSLPTQHCKQKRKRKRCVDMSANARRRRPKGGI
jgi:hypothetical protein